MKRHRSFELGSAKILEGMGYVNIATGTEVSGIICIINMHLSHIFDEGEMDSPDDEELTMPLLSHCCFYMYKTAYF